MIITWLVPTKYQIIFAIFCHLAKKNNTRETCSMTMVLGWWLRCSNTILINLILHTKISPFPCMQDGTCGTENCYGRGLMYSAWPIRMGWVAGSGWMPIWLTNADQLRSAHAEPGSQSNQPQSVRVTCGSSVKSVFWIWPLRPGCSKVSWDLWKGTINSARCLNRRYRYGARGMHYHILLRQYSQNCYTYNSVMQNTYSPCHTDACGQISIGNTKWLLRYKGVS